MGLVALAVLGLTACENDDAPESPRSLPPPMRSPARLPAASRRWTRTPIRLEPGDDFKTSLHYTLITQSQLDHEGQDRHGLVRSVTTSGT